MRLLNMRAALLAVALVACAALPASAGWFANAKGRVAGWFGHDKAGAVRTAKVEKRASSAFSHKAHADQAACKDCHEAAPGDKGRIALPGKEQCGSCHEDGAADKAAAAIKTDEPRSFGAEVIFSHAPHVEGGIACAACHVAPKQGEMGSPRMADCVACHAKTDAALTGCATCHTTIAKDKKPAFHDGAFRTGHGRFVQPRPASAKEDCGLCHKPASCTQCHRTEAPRSHNGFWAHRGHGLAASVDRTSCATCHRPDACDACHRESAPSTHRAGFGGTKNRHCVSCHLPLSRTGCQTCHKQAPSHAQAPARPANTAHKRATNATCRECHVATKMRHPDNGDACLECHR